jgi:hypothetical protein
MPAHKFILATYGTLNADYGLIVANNEYMFISMYTGIYRMRSDGSELMKIYDGYASQLFLFENELYFIGENRYLYKLNQHTGSATARYELGAVVSPFEVKLYDGILYYVDIPMRLVATNLMTGEFTFLTSGNESVFCFAISDGYIYFSSMTDDVQVSISIWRMTLDGNNRTKIFDGYGAKLQVAMNRLWFVGGDGILYGTLHGMNFDGSDVRSEGIIVTYEFNVMENGDIYYISVFDFDLGTAVYVASGGLVTPLLTHFGMSEPTYIHVLGDWIYLVVYSHTRSGAILARRDGDSIYTVLDGLDYNLFP